METGLRLQAGRLYDSTNSVGKEMVRRSVSTLCSRSCAAIQRQAQSAAATRADGAEGGAALGEGAQGTTRLVEAGLPGILAAVMALRQCLSRQATSIFFSFFLSLCIIYYVSFHPILSRFTHLLIFRISVVLFLACAPLII